MAGTLVFTACSSGGGGGGGATGVSKLSPEQQQAFQAWLKSRLKNCDASEIVGSSHVMPDMRSGEGGFPDSTTFPDSPGFPGMPPMPPRRPVSPPAAKAESEKGIDLAVLAERTGGSMWISATPTSETFAILSGGASGFTSGVSNSKFEEAVTINGVEQKVKVETQSSGFDCTVKINDVEVAKLALAKSVEIAAATSGTAKFQPLAIDKTQILRDAGSTTIFNSSSLRRAIETTMRDEAGATAQLKRIGYSEAEAKKYFVLGGGLGSGSFGVEFATPAPRSITFADGNEILFTEEAFPFDAANLTFATVYRSSGSSIAGVAFGTGPTQVMTIRRTVRVEEPIRGPEAKKGTITFDDMNLQTVVASQPTNAEVDQCVKKRIGVYASFYRNSLRQRQATEIPSRRTMFGPCLVYEPALEARFISNGGARTVLNQLLNTISRDMLRLSGVRFTFGDWSGFVSDSVTAALTPVSTSVLADPQLSAVILTEVDQYVTEAKKAPSYAQMSASFAPAFSDLIVALGESSRGVSIEAPLIRRSVQAAVKVGEAYVQPFARLLNSRSGAVNGTDTGLSWIESVSPTLLQAGREAADEARALDYSEYLSQTHEQFFHVRPTEASLTNVRDRMRTVRTQIAGYPQLAGVKGKLTTVLMKSSLNPAEVPETIRATANMAGANDAIALSYLEMLQQNPGSPETVSARAWALSMNSADQQAVQDYVKGAAGVGFESEARSLIREYPKTRPTAAELQARVVATQLAMQFLQAEAARAQGSSRDVFYESDAKDLARRIGLEFFTAADVAALDTFAQVAASDVFCGNDNKTISARLKCASLDRFSKKPRKLLSTEYNGRYVAFASKVAGWMQRLLPMQDHSTVRRSLKNGLFGNSDAGPWGSCPTGQFDVNNLALDQAVQLYFQSIGDFSARFKAERAVSTALDARCP